MINQSAEQSALESSVAKAVNWRTEYGKPLLKRFEEFVAKYEDFEQRALIAEATLLAISNRAQEVLTKQSVEGR